MREKTWQVWTRTALSTEMTSVKWWSRRVMLIWHRKADHRRVNQTQGPLKVKTRMLCKNQSLGTTKFEDPSTRRISLNRYRTNWKWSLPKRNWMKTRSLSLQNPLPLISQMLATQSGWARLRRSLQRHSNDPTLKWMTSLLIQSATSKTKMMMISRWVTVWHRHPD